MYFSPDDSSTNVSWPYTVANTNGSGGFFHFQTLWGLTCYIQNGSASPQRELGTKISSVFVVFVVSTCFTVFPVLATKQKKVKIPLYVYLFARYFGSGVITATALIHLLDPSYYEIGQNTCVGMNPITGGYSWPPAIALASAMMVFFMDFAADRYVEKKYGISHEVIENPVAANAGRSGSIDEGMLTYAMASRRPTVPHSHAPHVHAHGEITPSTDGNNNNNNNNSDSTVAAVAGTKEKTDVTVDGDSTFSEEKERATELAFRQQIAAFLILEFGVIFHSVIIGLTLGAGAPAQFNTLYPVIIFHQSFEGLGVGARLSSIPFPRRFRWMPWVFVMAYGLTTPIATAIGIGIGNTYNPTGYTASAVAGVLDAISAGILIYTGFVELLARDFIFNPERPDDTKKLTFMSVSVLLGAGIMALIGKWA